MNSFKNHNYEQALIETYLKLDECLNNPQVNDFLYEMNYQNGEETQEENTINNEIYDNIYPEIKDNSKLTKIKFKDKSIYVDLMNNNIEDEGNKFKVAKEMGTTANIIMIINNTLYLANCGDSVSVMFKNGQAIKLSQEHKTTLKSEYDRIVKSGGHILNNRIEGKLNLTRAIGDLAFKNNKNLKFYDQSVTSYPEINKIKNLEGIEFIIMGCDGLWDCVKPQKLCESISKKLKQGDSIADFKLSDIIGDIFDQILSKTNNSKFIFFLFFFFLILAPIGTDNMSCIIIEFLQNRTKKIKVTELSD